MDTPKPSVQGKYSIRNPAANAAFRTLDALLEACTGLSAKPSQVIAAAPRRILLSNIAHYGDVIMATSLVPVLKDAYPGIKIGFLAGSWAQPLLRHPDVHRVHVLDHWAHNRAGLTKRQKAQQYLRTRQTALRELRAARYEVAVDLYWNFPNTLPLLWQAKIPVRIGYESGGFGPLATHALEFGDKRLPASERFLDLVKVLPNIETNPAALRPVLPPPDPKDILVLESELRDAGVEAEDFIVFHVGAADSFRDWPAPKWRELARLFTAAGKTLVFTGTGAKDEARVGEVTDGLSGCVNLCGRLPWGGFVAAISRARLLVCVDTVAGHVAAATRTPCVVLTAGRWPYLWRPLGPQCRVLTQEVPCAPCHRNNGCAGMECLRDLSVAEVFQAAEPFLAAPGSESPVGASRK